jgi:hypothetical protein
MKQAFKRTTTTISRSHTADSHTPSKQYNNPSFKIWIHRKLLQAPWLTQRNAAVQSNPQQHKKPRNAGLCCATGGTTNTAFTVYYHYSHKSGRDTNHSNTAHPKTRKRNHVVHTRNTLPTSYPSSHNPTPAAILLSHSIHHHTHNHAITSSRQPTTATQPQHKHTPTSTPHSPKDDVAQHKHTQHQTIPSHCPEGTLQDPMLTLTSVNTNETGVMRVCT